MEIKKCAVVGTLESSDVQIIIEPNIGNGIEIELNSVVKKLFGNSIIETINKTLKEFEVDNAKIVVNDKGALDHIIKARMQAAICRAAEINYDWTREN